MHRATVFDVSLCCYYLMICRLFPIQKRFEISCVLSGARMCACVCKSVCMAQRCFSAINVMLMVNGLMKPHN